MSIDVGAGASERMRYVRVLPASIERVWRALTTAEELEAWLPGVSRIELVPGGRVWFSATGPDRTPHVGAVRVLDPPRMLRIEGPAALPAEIPGAEGARYLQFELESVPSGTRLTFSASAALASDGEDDAVEPADASTQVRPGFVAGLDCLGDLLGAGPAGLDVESVPFSRARFLELVAVYYDHVWRKCED